jgi:LysR family hydrogen peroxide-inducible transcriptional activator
MTLIELRYLTAVATEGSFSRAAEKCGVSQPTLSVAIARIEQELGATVFERTKTRVRVTELGGEIVAQARRILHEADKIREIAAAGTDQLARPFRLGVIHTVGPYLLPRLIAELKAVAPKMPLVIEENMTTTLSVMLAANEIDAAVIALPFDVPGIHLTPIYDEQFVVVVPRGHRWEGRAALQTDDLAEEEVLLLKAGHCFRDHVLGACPQVSVSESDAHLGFSVGTLRSMVASGLGISVLPASAMAPPYGSDLVSVVPFAEPVPSRRIAVASRKGFARPQALAALKQAFGRIHAAAFLPVGKA